MGLSLPELSHSGPLGTVLQAVLSKVVTCQHGKAWRRESLRGIRLADPIGLEDRQAAITRDYGAYLICIN